MQIDETYANFALLAKVTVTTDLVGVQIGAYLNVTGDTPIIAIRSETHFVAHQFTTRSGSSWSFFVQAFNADGTLASGADITCYVYDKPWALVGPFGYGLAVWDAAGALTFHSSRRYLRVEALLTGADYRTSLPAATYPAGRTYAVIPAKLIGTIDVDSVASGSIGEYINSFFMQILGFKFGATTLSGADCLAVEDVQTSTTPNIPEHYDYVDYAYLVVDVTHQ
ncbi:hypothetical protein FYJ91_20475 [Sphingomonas montanisoli]|uniref:Uncharacterized protein n=1 Tax=Sphingomonas montanisoli TaxID=2606412 RepID=A0A5D9BX49_9SPHN|nr:hypothetical protein FYJ91_20475 [Sphingomonas montanisoli]